MGLIGTVKGFARLVKGASSAQFSRVTLDTGAGANQDTPHFSDAGDDSQPLEGDLAQASSTRATNGLSTVGYIDQKNAGITQPGEKRIYARDADGVIVASYYMQNDGTIIIQNDTATITIDPAGNFDFAGGTFTINGQVFANHTHKAAPPILPGTQLLDSVNGAVTGNTGDVT